jgi:hypothetical protein
MREGHVRSLADLGTMPTYKLAKQHRRFAAGHGYFRQDCLEAREPFRASIRARGRRREIDFSKCLEKWARAPLQPFGAKETALGG